MQGICCAPYAEGNRLWFVTSRGEVACLDAEGFHDGEDDGPLKNELGRLFDVAQNEDPAKDKLAGMVDGAERRKGFARSGGGIRGQRMHELPDGVMVKQEQQGKKWSFAAKIGDADRQIQSICSGSIHATSECLQGDHAGRQGRSRRHLGARHDEAAGRLAAQHVQLLGHGRRRHPVRQHVERRRRRAHQHARRRRRRASSPWTRTRARCCGPTTRPAPTCCTANGRRRPMRVIGGVPQVIFGGGDGWLYSFRGEATTDGKAELLWKFDCNPKESKYVLAAVPTATTSSARRWSTTAWSTSAWAKIRSTAKASATCGASIRPSAAM